MRLIMLNLLFFLSSCKLAEEPNQIRDWFDEGALNCDSKKDLHFCSQWKYLSADEFAEMIMDGVDKMDPPLSDSESIFDLGVGVGAPFQVLMKQKKDLHVGGSENF